MFHRASYKGGGGWLIYKTGYLYLETRGGGGLSIFKSGKGEGWRMEDWEYLT